MAFTEFDLDLLREQMNAVVQLLVASGAVTRDEAAAHLEKKTKEFIQKRREGRDRG